jgi:glycosyltransferase involved in cell wall biosynthesis
LTENIVRNEYRPDEINSYSGHHAQKMKRVLMIAYHFPPLAGSSGIQRTLRFMKYLPRLGWEPIVLTAHPRAYERTSQDLLNEIPSGTVVGRAQAFDAARHFSLLGRYPGLLARPDRWVSWLPGASMLGLSMIKRYKPDVIWSTYPIATAHLIGANLKKHSGLPWIADFRDPMVQSGYPSDPKTWQSFKKIEEATTRQASICTFTTPGAVDVYSERYPDAASHFHVIENGYDEETFAAISINDGPLNPGRITFLHSGIVYPSERDPTQFLAAILTLIDTGKISPNQICIRFRAAVHEAFLQSLIDKLNLNGCIELLPPVPYNDALVEMMRADVLVIMQASNCNDQVPAKLYEYLRAGRPTIALTDPAGDTARVLRDSGISAIAPLDRVDSIAELLARTLEAPTVGTLALPQKVEAASRKSRTEELANLLNSVTSQS